MSVRPRPAAGMPCVEISRTDLFERMGRAIRYITRNRDAQPSLADMAAVAGLSPDHFQRVFTRHVGLSPKRFLGVLTLDAAKRALDADAPLLSAALEAGLSGPSRLHDLFVTHEAITPGDHKRAGEGLALRYGFHPTPFGLALIVASDRGIVGLAFADEAADLAAAPTPIAYEGADGWGRTAALEDMMRRFQKASFREDVAVTAPIAARIFDAAEKGRAGPLPLVLSGTNFQVRVWEALLAIPAGHTTTYSTLAEAIGAPGSARAVAGAVGSNPISYLIPCHRVVRRDGGLGGYHWGLTTKRAILAYEEGSARP